jgi:SAM-dependent methyltransferase
LEGTLGIIKSKIYMDGVYDDIKICQKKLKKNGKILDFGTGCGFYAWFLSFLGYKSFGVDIDDFDKFDGMTRATENMVSDQSNLWSKLEKGNNNLKIFHYKNKLPFENNYFDMVIAAAVLEHVEEKELSNVLLEIRRVLKPGGYFLISRLPRKLSYLEYMAKIMKMGHHQRLYGDMESKNMIELANFKKVVMELTDFCPSYPLNFVNKFYFLMKKIDKLALKTPLKFLSHDIRLVAVKG